MKYNAFPSKHIFITMKKSTQYQKLKQDLTESEFIVWQKNKNLKFKYGITYDEYITMYENQNKSCAICNTELPAMNGNKGLLVDHCHTTGKVRGLLCNRCNTGTFLFENESLRSKTMNYLGIK